MILTPPYRMISGPERHECFTRFARLLKTLPMRKHPAGFAFLVLILTVSGFLRQPAASAAGDEKDATLKKLLPRTKPLEPAEALKSFRLEKGFRLELVAAEPNVVDPIALAFDEDGRMYVAEMIDYPDKPSPTHPPQGRIRLLEDTKGNGVYDKSTVFADKLTWPGGVAPWKGGVFVCTTPDIFYLKDTDGDRKADVRRVVYTGFKLGKAEDIANGLMLGLDGKIYGVTSFNGGDIRPADRPDAVPVSVRGRDFRFDPRTGVFDAISSANGDFGNTFDDGGNRFVCNSGMLLKHLVLTGDYLARNPHLAVTRVHQDVAQGKDRVFRISPPEPWRVVRQQFWQRWVNTSHDMRAARFPPRELAPTGYVTGGAGATLYRGSAFPEGYYGNAFIGEVAGNVVVRLLVRPDGVTFTCDRAEEGREFLASTDTWFRPVNFANGPDGCLYVLDMYREVIEDPSAIPADILKHLDVTSGSDRGRIYRIVPEGFRRPRPPRLSAATTTELVAALERRDAWWRETAQRLLTERQDKSAVQPLRRLARSAEFGPTRLHALWTLEALAALDEATLLQALNDPEASVREHAVRLSEGRLSESAPLRERVFALADDPAPRVRFQVAFSLGGLTGDRAIATLARIARRDAADPWIGTAVLSALPELSAPLLQMLIADHAFVKQPAAGEFLGTLAGVVGGRKQTGEVLAALDAVFRSDRQGADRLRRVIVTGLGEGLGRTGGSLGEFLRTAAPSPQTAAALAKLFESATKIAQDEGQPPATRVEAVRLLSHAPFETAAPVLADLLTARQAQALQLAAIQALSALPRAEVGNLLIEHWPAFSPAVRREAAEALFSRADRLPALVRALERREIPVGDLDPVRVQALRKHPDQALHQRAEKVLAATPRTDRKQVVEQYRPALALKGDAKSGAALFEKHCTTCHQLGGKGRSVGPDLATVLNRTDEELLTAILDPNREVKPNYVNYTLATTSGKVITGIIAQETATTITLRRAEGVEDTVLRNQVEQLGSSGLSLMPEGFEKQLSPQQLADLLRYVRGAGKAGGP
jgi:putative membrane-bound dehydrogenase-like protein